MADLEALAADIKTIGEKIVALKAMTPVNKENIGAAVQELLEAKKLYAESNNGIGIDGKPFETLTKSEKKKKANAEKGESGPAKPVRKLGHASQIYFFYHSHVQLTMAFVRRLILTR
jgi:hypothetical protein